MSWLDILSYHHFLYAIFKVHKDVSTSVMLCVESLLSQAYALLDVLACYAMTERLSSRGGHIYSFLTVLSVIRNLNLFNSLITGKTSYHNSTALLTGLAAISCCSSVPVSMINCFTAADLPSFPEIKKLIRIFFIFLIWRPPTLPHRLQCSTIGRLGLNHRVRDGNGCVPQAHRHQK